MVSICYLTTKTSRNIYRTVIVLIFVIVLILIWVYLHVFCLYLHLFVEPIFQGTHTDLKNSNIFALSSKLSILEGKFTRSPKGDIYIIFQGTLQYIPNCYPCGDFLSFCSSSHPFIPWTQSINIPISETPYKCDDAPDSIGALMEQFEFSNKPRLVEAADGVLYFVYLNKVKWIANCWDCGPLYNVCKNFQYLSRKHKMSPFALSRIGHWQQSKSSSIFLEEKSGLPDIDHAFICHEDDPEMVQPLASEKWLIISPPNTYFLAKYIAKELQKHRPVLFPTVDILETLTIDLMDSREYDIYIILSANIYKPNDLPPANRRMILQMKPQSSYWSKEYVDVLRESYAVLEYNKENLEFLKDKNIPTVKLWYLPLGIYSRTPSSIFKSNFFGNKKMKQNQLSFQNKKLHDLLFYGNIRSNRQERMLRKLSTEFNVKVITEHHGDEMDDLIQKSRFVINIHFSTIASLDVFLLYEFLSLGVPVISEDSPDSHMYPYLHQSSFVHFFDLDSTRSMIEVIRKALLLEKNKNEGDDVIIDDIQSIAEKSYKQFNFYFNRIIFGMELIPINSLNKLVEQSSEFKKNIPKSIRMPVILSMPESMKRQKQFIESTTIPIGPIFDGVRHLLRGTWMATAMSYSIMAQLTLKAGMKQIAIAEDDVIFPRNYNQSISIIEEYLNSLGDCEWDMFSGLIADLHPDTIILSSKYYKGIQFVTINKMVSMVYNIYNLKLLQLISEWNPLDGNVMRNTIDRYIERQGGLKVVVTIPFFVEHRVEAKSTIWTHDNSAYEPMIHNSQLKLQDLFNKYLESKRE